MSLLLLTTAQAIATSGDRDVRVNDLFSGLVRTTRQGGRMRRGVYCAMTMPDVAFGDKIENTYRKWL